MASLLMQPQYVKNIVVAVISLLWYGLDKIIYTVVKIPAGEKFVIQSLAVVLQISTKFMYMKLIIEKLCH